MSKALGALVFVAGVAGLGYWGAKSHAVSMENKITSAAEAVIAGAVHPMQLAVSGRDITLSGLADTPAERDRLLAGLDAIRGRRVVNAEAVEVLPEIAPYETGIAKGEDGSVAFTGYAPSAALAADLPGGEALELGHGAPDGWLGAMTAGAGALAPLDAGSFGLTGTTLTLSGVAATPAEDAAARAALGDQPGFDEVIALDVTDPGIIDFTLSYDASNGYGIDGTLPESLSAGALATALGVEALDGEAGHTFADIPGLDDRLGALAGLAGRLERFSLHGSNAGLALDGEALSGLDADQLRSQLSAALGGKVVLAPAARPEDGTERTNAATGKRQMAFGGHWLPVPDFTPTKAACTDAAMSTVEAQPIRFVTGSAALDPASLDTLNDIAGIVLLCTRDAGMRVTVGGHTDAQGDDTANYSLSVARAKAVRDALIARGIPAAKITAVGYGETEPVADNETEEGRAQNRRTTFAWPD